MSRRCVGPRRAKPGGVPVRLAAHWSKEAARFRGCPKVVQSAPNAEQIHAPSLRETERVSKERKIGARLPNYVERLPSSPPGLIYETPIIGGGYRLSRASA